MKKSIFFLLAIFFIVGIGAVAQIQRDTVTSDTITIGTSLPLTGGTLTGNILFSPDNAFDIGANGATRPRFIFSGDDIQSGNDLIVDTSNYVRGTDDTDTGVWFQTSEINFSVDNSTIIEVRPTDLEFQGTADLIWETDGGGNIGASGANRPTTIWLVGDVIAGDDVIVGDELRLQSNDTLFIRDAAAVIQVGLDSATPSNYELKSGDGSATNSNGGDVILEGGIGQGSGLEGTIGLRSNISVDTTEVYEIGADGLIFDKIWSDAYYGEDSDSFIKIDPNAVELWANGVQIVEAGATVGFRIFGSVPLVWITDGGGDIGKVADDRPNNIYAANDIVAGGSLATTADTTLPTCTSAEEGNIDYVKQANTTGSMYWCNNNFNYFELVPFQNTPADVWLVSDMGYGESGATMEVSDTGETNVFVTDSSNDANHLAGIGLQTSTSTGNEQWIAFQGGTNSTSGNFLGGDDGGVDTMDNWTCEVMFKTTTSVADILIIFGASSDFDDENATHMAFFEFDTAADTNFQAITRDGTGEAGQTQTDTGVVPALDTWYSGLITYDGTDIKFYLRSGTNNYTLEATHTTDLPTTELSCVAYVQTLTTAAKRIDVDWMRISALGVSR